jgi:hypothetical protein
MDTFFKIVGVTCYLMIAVVYVALLVITWPLVIIGSFFWRSR